MSPIRKSETKIEIGKILRPHALKGECKVQVFSKDPSIIEQYSQFEIKETVYVVESSRPVNDGYLIKFKGYDSIESVENLRGVMLLVGRDTLVKEGEYLVSDFIGLKVYEKTNGDFRGEIKCYYEAGSGGLYGLSLNEKEIYVPLGSDLWDPPQLGEGKVCLNDPEGLYIVS